MIIMNRISLIHALQIRAYEISNGKQFEPAGGQILTDATDFRYIAQLLKEHRDEKAKRIIHDLDTASRDALPEDVWSWANE